MNIKKKRILLGVTGSIAAYKSAEIIRKILKKNLDISVVMTEAAKEFITPLTLSTLSNGKTYSGIFDLNNDWSKVQHIDLAKESDVLLIAPATANIIGKITHGIADDLLTCLCLATKAPILIAPAMNDAMYDNKIVKDNCQALKKSGVIFISPEQGELACGDVGIGRLAEVDTIVKEVIAVCR